MKRGNELNPPLTAASGQTSRCFQSQNRHKFRQIACQFIGVTSSAKRMPDSLNTTRHQPVLGELLPHRWQPLIHARPEFAGAGLTTYNA